MKIATSELKHLREEVKNCHQIIKDLQKKREFVGLTDEDLAVYAGEDEVRDARYWERVCKEKNT